jgi:acyl-[acyl carrier protein]--UDP-N-acetylglucosamine O-acyltransferase
MEGVHISHDTKVDDYVTFGYGTKVAGDCEVHSAVIFSSGVIVNSNVRIGGASMVTGGVRISKDVPPFIVATDNPVRYAGVNESLLKSSGTSEKVISHIANAYRLVFHGQTSVFDAINQVKEQVPAGKEITAIVKFLESTKLGIISKL